MSGYPYPLTSGLNSQALLEKVTIGDLVKKNRVGGIFLPTSEPKSYRLDL